MGADRVEDVGAVEEPLPRRRVEQVICVRVAEEDVVAERGGAPDKLGEDETRRRSLRRASAT